MSWRAIQDSVNRSESLAGLSHAAERLYWRLLSQADPYGRLAASPNKLRAQCWPLVAITDTEAAGALLELADAGRITVYHADGVNVLELADFEANQPTEAIRRRGNPKLPGSPGGSRTTPGHSRTNILTIYKVPANGATPGLLPEPPGLVPPRREEKRREEQQQQHYVARANPNPAADVDRAAAALNELGLTIARWPGVDPALVLAWVELAGTEARTNPAGFVRSGIESGSWPSPRSSPAENGSRPRRAIAEVVRDIIRNVGAELDPHAFAAEVAQLEARRGETIPRDLAEELVEEHRKVSQSQFAADPGPDAA